MRPKLPGEITLTVEDNESSLVFEVFELVQQDPPQLWRTERRSRQDVHLTPLEARVLVFLAQRPMRWVSVETLADDVWYDPETESGSVHATMFRLRRKLSGFEHLIEGGLSKYRLNTQVSTKTGMAAKRPSLEVRGGRLKASPFTVQWWVLVPFLPGRAPLGNPIRGVEVVSQHADSTEYKTRDPAMSLLWYNCGAAVWVVRKRVSFPSIAAFAKEREAYYDEILWGNHAIRKITTEILQTASRSCRIPQSVQSTISYAFSMIGVEELIWTAAEVDHAVKLLSCPNLLSGYAMVEGRVRVTPSTAQSSAISQQETDFIRHGFRLPETKPFNFAGAVCGHASWSGVAFYLPPDERLVFESEFVSYEARLQALWLSLDHYTKLLDQGEIRAIPPKVKREIQRQSRLVFNAGATEKTPLRLFKEAVIVSSRIERHWETFQTRL